MIAGMTYYQICMYFLIYSFAGWVVEVIYHAVDFGKVINRGFLNGPVCPVYGFGMLAVLAAGNVMTDRGGAADVTQMNGVELFFFGMILTTLVELIAGWMLDKLFQARWWDYSKKPFNLHGYICLEFSIIWGLAIELVVKVAHPLIQEGTADRIPPKYGWPVMAALYVLYLVDFIVTVMTVSGLNKKLRELDHVRAVMRMPSDKLTDLLASTSMDTAQQVQETQVQAALGKVELREKAMEFKEEKDLRDAVEKAKRDERIAQYRADLEKRAEELMADISGHRAFGTGRLLRAFPTLQHERYADSVEELRKRIAAEKIKDTEEKKADEADEKEKAA
jgi:uncharacterized membrane protein